jgi:sugar lactone lactonase YvrE
MARNLKIAIRSLALAAAVSLVFAMQTRAGEPAADTSALWVASQNNVSVFQGHALEHSGKPSPHLAFKIKDYLNPSSMAFDQHNNLWIVSAGTDVGSFPIIEVTRTDIASLKSGKLVKRRVIFSHATGIPNTPWSGLGFDAAGNLWASDLQAIFKLSASQIEEERAPSPSVVLAEPAFFTVPRVTRFDASDNLWVSAQQMWRFTRADRRVSGNPNPSLTVNLPDALKAVDAAFDRSENMWLAGAGAHGAELEMILAGDLAGSGEISPSAAATITSSAFGSGSCLGGMDFDRSGDLWVSVTGTDVNCEENSQLVAFTPDQLSVGGNLTPSITISQNKTKTNLSLPGPIRFGPKVKSSPSPAPQAVGR